MIGEILALSWGTLFLFALRAVSALAAAVCIVVVLLALGGAMVRVFLEEVV